MIEGMRFATVALALVALPACSGASLSAVSGLEGSREGGGVPEASWGDGASAEGSDPPDVTVDESTAGETSLGPDTADEQAAAADASDVQDAAPEAEAEACPWTGCLCAADGTCPAGCNGDTCPDGCCGGAGQCVRFADQNRGACNCGGLGCCNCLGTAAPYCIVAMNGDAALGGQCAADPDAAWPMYCSALCP